MTTGVRPFAILESMTATKLDGKMYRDEIFEDLAARVTKLKEAGVRPGLATVLVGDDPGSHSYVKMKHRDCEQIGISSIRRDLPAETTQEELEAVIAELNADDACTGYIVQLPLPKHLDENRILGLIDPEKDADGLHPVNLGKLVLNEPAPLPCTPNGCIHLLRRFGVELAGAKVCVIGRGVTVGRPIGLMLTRRSENSTVTLCHTGTKDLAAETRQADVVIAAAGKAHMLTAWSSRVRRCLMWGCRVWTASWPATCIRMCGRLRARCLRIRVALVRSRVRSWCAMWSSAPSAWRVCRGWLDDAAAPPSFTAPSGRGRGAFRRA